MYKAGREAQSKIHKHNRYITEYNNIQPLQKRHSQTDKHTIINGASCHL